MNLDEVVALVGGWDGVLTLAPGPGDGTPEIAWGDLFFYYAPDGEVPQTTQPFATVVTKDYPGDEACRLDRAGVFRVNVHAGRAAVEEVAASEAAQAVDLAALDQVVVHPVYGTIGWLAVVCPGPSTSERLAALLLSAYDDARARYDRRHDLVQGS
ncbi:DUF6194 family protein [Sanguibacter sp. 25GB23B1]|uniref:DUF6194 family protein n=1 Tax=unclassified Sanguibacter TaxID=2645534 RepID=UPI0032AFF16F